MADKNNEKDVQQETNTQSEGNGTQAERTFTQEEVNKIISERLTRERTKAEPTAEEQKTKELNARESRIACREYLLEKGYPSVFADTVDTSDTEEFMTKVENIYNAIGVTASKRVAPLGSTEPNMHGKGLSEAFSPSVKHTPKAF
jgi:hypothetical protein